MGQFTTWIMLVILVVVLTVSMTWIRNDIEELNTDLSRPSIGGSVVPTVHCPEDAVIWWLGPDTLGCLHFEQVK